MSTEAPTPDRVSLAGATYAAYAALSSLSADDPRRVDHLLIIGLLSSFKAWQDEFRDIFLRDARAKRIAGFVPPGDRSAYLRGVSYGERDVELILLENYFLPGDLERQVEAFVDHYNHRRYHESLGNLTPADVCFGRGDIIRLETEWIKRETIKQRRLLYREAAA
jgi:transposase InsO family protein